MDLRSNLLRLWIVQLVIFCFRLHDDNFIIGPDLFLEAFQRGARAARFELRVGMMTESLARNQGFSSMNGRS